MPDSNIIQPVPADPAQDLVGALQETSMLSAIRITRLGLGRADKAAGEAVARQHGALTDATRLTVNRLAGADHYHNQIAKLQNAARDRFNAITLAWGGDDGWRLLPNAHFAKVLQEISPISAEIARVMEEMKADLPNIVAKATQGVGSLNVKPPTADEIAQGYSMQVVFQPLPDGSQFRGLPAATVTALSKHIQARARGAWEAAQADATGRVAEALTHMIDRLDIYQNRMDRQARGEDVGRLGVFNDTLITNVQELAELLPVFNVTKDPRLTELAERLHAMGAGVTGDTLRKDQAARDAAVAKAKDMLDVLAVWKGQP